MVVSGEASRAFHHFVDALQEVAQPGHALGLGQFLHATVELAQVGPSRKA